MDEITYIMQEIYSESPSDIQFPIECGQQSNVYMILIFEICIEVSIENALYYITYKMLILIQC